MRKTNREKGYSVCNYTGENKSRTTDLFIASMITDQIGRHKVLLPFDQKSYNFREKNSQVMKERENVH